jgi:hypothetical protein
MMRSLSSLLRAVLLALVLPAAAAAEAPAPGAEITVTGMLTDEGVECPALRSDDGRLYTLATRDLGSFHSGDRVTVEGTVAEVSICMQGTTIEVKAIAAAKD